MYCKHPCPYTGEQKCCFYCDAPDEECGYRCDDTPGVCDDDEETEGGMRND